MTLETPPSPWIQRWIGLCRPGGTALDVAAGGGRHTLLLSAHGLAVSAVDRDAAALRARVAGCEPAVRVVEAELEAGAPWPFAGETFDAVVVANYLHRPLFPALLAAVAPGGAFLHETFMVGNERHGRPRNPDFLLRDGELLDVARAGGLSVVAYEALEVAMPRPAVVQRVAARRPAGA
ncbi:MAG: class I SAM-dependent methyltransferase [Rhodospirillales bacterium]|nr:MAG: class I SAM-dependent methyltransferase [Rhodospirillales bacterium]